MCVLGPSGSDLLQAHSCYVVLECPHISVSERSPDIHRPGKDSELGPRGLLCAWVLEKTLESPLDCKEIRPVHLKGDQSWVFIGRTDVEAETPILWPPHAKT